MLIENAVVGLKVIVNAPWVENEVKYIIDFKRALSKGQFVTNSDVHEDEGNYAMYHEMEPYGLMKGRDQ